MREDVSWRVVRMNDSFLSPKFYSVCSVLLAKAIDIITTKVVQPFTLAVYSNPSIYAITSVTSHKINTCAAILAG